MYNTIHDISPEIHKRTVCDARDFLAPFNTCQSQQIPYGRKVK